MLSVILSGPRRIKAGAARDHGLGVKAVRARLGLKAGGRVVKTSPVTTAKLIAGSWGTLAVITELTLKVCPVDEDVETVLALGLSMRARRSNVGGYGFGLRRFGSGASAQKTAERMSTKAGAGVNSSVTAFRLGHAPSIAYRREKLEAMLRPFVL